jgi:hypothetical protein
VQLGQLADLRFVAAHQDRLDLDLGAVLEGEASGVADGKDRPQQMLAVAHPAGDAVHGDADRLCFEAHVSSSSSRRSKNDSGKRIPAASIMHTGTSYWQALSLNSCNCHNESIAAAARS